MNKKREFSKMCFEEGDKVIINSGDFTHGEQVIGTIGIVEFKTGEGYYIVYTNNRNSITSPQVLSVPWPYLDEELAPLTKLGRAIYE